MLAPEDNELVTNTNRGTPMGEVFRHYWLPVALSEELPGPDCEPLRVRILGEDLIAFRDTNGNVGLVDAYCPHRGAPMFFARNEEAGLRCVYHGWKFDTTGQCVDMPNTPEETPSRTRSRSSRTPAARPARSSSRTWARRRSSLRSPSSTSRTYRRRTSTSRSSSSSATGCRPPRVTSIPRTVSS